MINGLSPRSLLPGTCSYRWERENMGGPGSPLYHVSYHRWIPSTGVANKHVSDTKPCHSGHVTYGWCYGYSTGYCSGLHRCKTAVFAGWVKTRNFWALVGQKSFITDPLPVTGLQSLHSSPNTTHIQAFSLLVFKNYIFQYTAITFNCGAQCSKYHWHLEVLTKPLTTN